MSTINVNAQGSNASIAYIKETTVGTTPTTGTAYEVKCAGESFDATQATEFNSDISRTGGKTGTVRGLKVLSGGVTSQLESGAYDDFILSLLRRADYTTDTYASVTGASGTATELTFTGTSMSLAIVGAPIKSSGFTDPNANGIFRVISAGSTTIVCGKTSTAQDFSAVSETGASGTLIQKYAKNLGNQVTSFTVEKRLSQINVDNGFLRLKGEQANSATFSVDKGGAVSVAWDFKGLSNSKHSDAMVSPYGWKVNGAFSAGVLTIDILSGTTDPVLGDKFYLEDDTTNTEYTIVSNTTSTIVFTPALGGDITDTSSIFFETPATDGGTDQKMENNLGYVLIGGVSHCISTGSISITPNLTELNCVGNDEAVELIAGDRSVTGTIVPYFSSNIQSILDDVDAFVRFPISLFMGDSLGNMICVQVPRAIADQEMVKRADQGVLSQNIPFKAEVDSTTDTNCIIHVLTA